mgnify:CR=1 FL=1
MPRAQQHVRTGHCLAKRYPSGAGILITMEEIEQFLALYETLDRAEGTVKLYRRKLTQFYQDLPEDKRLRHGFMESWRGSLLKKYRPASVNASQSAVNAFLDHIGHREYQLVGQLKEEKVPPPELSRAEYLHLLHTSKALGNEKVYLIIKLFVCTGFFVKELPNLTVEAVREGRFICCQNRTKQNIIIPACIQKELLRFAERSGISSGPVFRTRSGQAIKRTYIPILMKPVCEAARIDDSRATPQALRRLYFSTRAGIESNISLLVEQAMERQLEQEQLSTGWEEER